MTVSLADFKTYVSIKPTVLDQDAVLLAALEAATDLLDNFLSAAWKPIPEAVYDQEVMRIAGNIFKAKDNVSGNAQTVDYSTGQPVMGPRDPLMSSYPVLRRYVLPF